MLPDRCIGARIDSSGRSFNPHFVDSTGWFGYPKDLVRSYAWGLSTGSQSLNQTFEKK